MNNTGKNSRKAFADHFNFAPKFVALALVLICGNGCSVRKFAANKIGDALSHTGTTFASDDDPDLIKDAAPFSLKLIEGFLAETPDHPGLLLAAASGFTQYAYAFVQEDAEEIEARDLAASNFLRARARRLYLRARNYGLRGLALTRPNFTKTLHDDSKLAVRATTLRDVPYLYWTAVSWAAAIALSKDNPELVADLPLVEALIDRALELDESFDHGAIHSFLISYEMSRRSGSGDPAARSRKHFTRACELSGGRLAAPFVALAEAVTIQKQDVKEFDSLLKSALSIDPDLRPESRLINLVMQRRARWLLSRKEELFLISSP